jgi:hypothetical protein
LDAWKIARLERRVVSKAELVTANTDDDGETFTRFGAKAVITLMPGWAGKVVGERTLTADVPRRVAILGHWDWHVKQANLEKFLTVADPMFAAEGAQIQVLGPAPERWREALTARLRATSFAGWVDNLGTELAQSRLGVVAEPAGGGFKHKSLDYIFNRLAVAALDGSVSGLPLGPDDLISAPDERQLAARVLAAMDDFERLNRMQEAAYAACQPLRGWDSQGRRLLEALQALNGVGARARTAPRSDGRPAGLPAQ